MLAVKCGDVNKLRFPVLGTPKFDGIRCKLNRPKIFVNDAHMCECVTRSLKPIPNHYIRENIQASCTSGADGELLAFPNNNLFSSQWDAKPFKLPTFQQCSSSIMSHDDAPDFRYYIFDLDPLECGGIKDPGYRGRVEVLAQLHLPPFCVKVLPVNIPDADHLAAYEAACISEGYEGVIIRTPDSPYKYGRSTLKEQWMVKIKRFEDSEAEVLEVQERYTNNNPIEKNALGYSERSTHQQNLSPAGDMGALRVRDLKTGVEFQIGTGFDALQRVSIWTFRSTYVGSILKYKFQPHGVKEAPRFPVFVGWRHKEDMS